MTTIEEKIRVMYNGLAEINCLVPIALSDFWMINKSDKASHDRQYDRLTKALRDVAKVLADVTRQNVLGEPKDDEKKDVLHIGCIPAKYLKVDGAWAAIAFNAAQQMYNVRVSGKKGKVVATFSIDGETKFTLEAGSFACAIQLACSASNAYIHMNQRAKERRHRRKANARAAAENKEPTDEKAQADMQQVPEVAR